MGNYPKAHEYYQKASQTKNPLLCPIYLKKAGIAAMELKKYKEATAYFSRVKKEFPKDLSAENIDSYIQLAKSLQN